MLGTVGLVWNKYQESEVAPTTRSPNEFTSESLEAEICGHPLAKTLAINKHRTSILML